LRIRLDVSSKKIFFFSGTGHTSKKTKKIVTRKIRPDNGMKPTHGRFMNLEKERETMCIMGRQSK